MKTTISPRMANFSEWPLHFSACSWNHVIRLNYVHLRNYALTKTLLLICIQQHLKPAVNNFPTEAKSASTSTAWWAQNNGVGVFSAGLSEAMPLHVTCHVASDGTKLESSGARHHSAVVSSMPGGGPGDPTQVFLTHIPFILWVCS